jgi:hypothetical protein
MWIALFVAVTTLMMFAPIGFRKMLGYGIVFDLGVTVLFIFIGTLTGSYAGASFGALVGGFITIIMFFARRTFSADRYVVKLEKREKLPIPKVQAGWERTPPQRWL